MGENAKISENAENARLPQVSGSFALFTKRAAFVERVEFVFMASSFPQPGLSLLHVSCLDFFNVFSVTTHRTAANISDAMIIEKPTGENSASPYEARNTPLQIITMVVQIIAEHFSTPSAIPKIKMKISDADFVIV